MVDETCLYCPGPRDSLEHPLPAALGEFLDAPFLENRICNLCNNTRLSLLDEQLSRCGPEAMLRRFFGVRGRKTHEKVNPHYRRSAGGGRLELKAFDTEMGVEVELECFDGQVRQSRQIVIVDSSGKTHNLPIPERVSPEELRAGFLKLNVKSEDIADARLIYDPKELVWLEPLVKAAFPSASFGEHGLGAKNYANGAVGKIELRDRYFRGIAKIGFHYFLTQFPTFDGSEPFFSDIREFIMDDSGRGMNRINDFIGERTSPLLGPMMEGFRPDGWRAHALCAEIGAEYLAHVQLFVCSDYSAPVYTVRLGVNICGIAVGATGHIYKHFGDGPKGRFAGEVRPLRVSHIALAPPLKPTIRSAT